MFNYFFCFYFIIVLIKFNNFVWFFVFSCVSNLLNWWDFNVNLKIKLNLVKIGFIGKIKLLNWFGYWVYVGIWLNVCFMIWYCSYYRFYDFCKVN